jgi:hypothetical protein
MTVTEHIFYLPLTKTTMLACGTVVLSLTLIAIRAIILSNSVTERLVITGVLIATGHIIKKVYSLL